MASKSHTHDTPAKSSADVAQAISVYEHKRRAVNDELSAITGKSDFALFSF